MSLLATHHFQKKIGGSNIATQFPVGTIRVNLQLILNFLIFLNYFLFQEHLAKGFLFEINIPKLIPYVGIISFFPLEMFLILLPAYVPFGFNILGFHRSYPPLIAANPSFIFDSQHQ